MCKNEEFSGLKSTKDFNDKIKYLIKCRFSIFDDNMNSAIAEADHQIGKALRLTDGWFYFVANSLWGLLADCDELPQFEAENSKIDDCGKIILSEYDRSRLKKAIDDILSYEHELLSLSYTEINQRYEAEIENRRFFNQENANVDLKNWLEFDSWQLDEAIALSFGKNPKIVTLKKLHKLDGKSEFASQYIRRHEAASRSNSLAPIDNGIQPNIFLQWLKRNKIESPLIQFANQNKQRNKSDIHHLTLEIYYSFILALAEKYGMDLAYYPEKGSTIYATMAKGLPAQYRVDPKTIRKHVLQASEWAVRSKKMKIKDDIIYSAPAKALRIAP